MGCMPAILDAMTRNRGKAQEAPIVIGPREVAS